MDPVVGCVQVNFSNKYPFCWLFFALLRSCGVSWACRNHKNKVVVILIGPYCLHIVLKGLGMNNHESHVFNIAFPLLVYWELFYNPQRHNPTTPEFLVYCIYSIVRSDAHMWSISLLMALSSVDGFISEWGGLWFPLIIILSESDFCLSPSIGYKC